MLCTSRTRGTLSAAACARSRMPAVSSGSTCTTTSLRGRAACTASSTLSAAAWPCPTAAPGRHADHDVRELASARFAHPQPLEVDHRADARDRGARRRLRLDRDAVHQHVDVRAHQARGGGEHERGDEQRRDRVGVVVAGANEQQADEHGGRAEQVAEEVERVRLERRAVELARGAPGDDRAARVDHDHDADDDERVPGGVDLNVRRSREALDGAEGDEDAHEHEDRCFRERGEVLRLAVPVLVPFVGRPRGDADGEEREQRRDEIRAGVKRLGEEREAVRREPTPSLTAISTTAANTDTSAVRRCGVMAKRKPPRRVRRPASRGSHTSSSGCHQTSWTDTGRMSAAESRAR